MTATARKRQTKPALTVVKNEPDLEQLENLLTDFAEQTAPIISRSGAAKQKAEAEIKALEGELDGVRAREAFVTRAFEALMKGFEAEKRDILATIGHHSAGITSTTLNDSVGEVSDDFGGAVS